jgi:hypothetical protein
MAQTEVSQPHLSEQPEPEVEQYRPVSGLAVVALILGLFSLTAWVEPFLIFVAAVGALVGVAAIWQVAAGAPEMLGRKAAIVGLFLSIFVLVGVASKGYTHRALIRNEAKRFAGQWFEFLLDHQPEKAFAMTRESGVEPEPLTIEGEAIAPPEGPSAAGYARLPEVHALLQLGDRAQVRYYQTELQTRKESGDEIQQVYAVTFDKDGTKTTFFVRLNMERSIDEKTGRASWQITSSRGGIKPVALGGSVGA